MDNMQMGIYKIENLINHKLYIGQTTNFHKRWLGHKSSFNQGKVHNLLYDDMRKYGIENFEFTIIEQCSGDMLLERERYWIEYFNTYNSSYGYNMTPGGNSNGYKTRKLDINDVLNIIALLPYRTQTDIAKLYNVDQAVISSINYGKSYHMDKIKYPICDKGYYLDSIRREDNYCIDCGKEINYKAIRCVKCNSLLRRNKNFPTRDELKLMIRNMSFTQIGQYYGVSDKAIRKWCISMNLPSTKQEIKSFTDAQWERI